MIDILLYLYTHFLKDEFFQIISIWAPNPPPKKGQVISQSFQAPKSLSTSSSLLFTKNLYALDQSFVWVPGGAQPSGRSGYKTVVSVDLLNFLWLSADGFGAWTCNQDCRSILYRFARQSHLRLGQATNLHKNAPRQPAHFAKIIRYPENVQAHKGLGHFGKHYLAKCTGYLFLTKVLCCRLKKSC